MRSVSGAGICPEPGQLSGMEKYFLIQAEILDIRPKSKYHN